MRLSAFVASAVCALAYAVSAHAAPPPAAYGRLPAVADAALSPDGTKVAILRTSGDTVTLNVLDTTEFKSLGSIAPPADTKLRAVSWANDKYVLVTGSVTYNPFSAVQTGSHLKTTSKNTEAQSEYYRTIAVSTPDMKSVVLTADLTASAYQTGAGTIWNAAAGETNSVRMTAAEVAGGSIVWTVHRADLETGAMTPVSRGASQTAAFVLSPSGEVLARGDTSELTNTWRLMARQGDGWKQVTETRTQFGGVPLLSYPYPDGKVGELILADARVELRAIDLTSGVRTLTFSDPTYDVAGAIVDPWTKEIVGASIVRERGEQHFFDPALEQVRVRLAAMFPNGAVQVLDWDRGRTTFILKASQATEAPTTYLFRPADGRLRSFGGDYPELAAADAGRRVSLNYRASDGTRIPAYLTLPPNGPDKNLPTIVMPHGGPAARDELSFDYLASFLASRGYAVLQPNFRGSGGYGRAWEYAGHNQWGGLMQKDVTDGVGALSRMGLVDPNRVCIVGASYGGYAALAGATLTPDLYKCAVSIAGVSDLQAMLNRALDRSGRKSETVEYWRASIGNDMAQVKAVSPIENVAAIRVPILLIHGDQDTVVPVEQSRAMDRKLRGAGKQARLVELPGEDHGISRAASRTRMLSELESFLAQSLAQ
jgi:dipeptidyl aminopeptidase/acylaminoacyl peptidase